MLNQNRRLKFLRSLGLGTAFFLGSCASPGRASRPSPQLDDVLKLRGNSMAQVRQHLGQPNDEQGNSLFYFVIDEPGYRSEARLYEFSFQNGTLQNIKKPAQDSPR